MKIKTTELKDIVNKACKGAGMNNAEPITTMLGIKSNSKGKVRFITTDKMNTLSITVGEFDDTNIDVSIDIDKFSKLVAKLTSEETEIKITDSMLIVKSNGEYKFPLNIDEEGLISFPDVKKVDGDAQELDISIIQNMFNIGKVALADSIQMPSITNYYTDEINISTNSVLVTIDKSQLLDGTPRLVPLSVISLLTMFGEDTVYKTNGDEFAFKSDNLTLYTTAIRADIEDYPVNPLKNFLDTEFKAHCTIPKACLIATLDRLSLFVDSFDKNKVRLTFKENELLLTSTDGSKESIPYSNGSEKVSEEYTCSLDILLLKSQLAVNPSEELNIYFGHEKCIKIDNDTNIVQFMAMLVDK